ncbi:MAG: hypothetical protein E7620_03295 [Ruminococcaceae bacterium]|nr:hypothetical protein [Oscillospiraceae bacterium]
MRASKKVTVRHFQQPSVCVWLSLGFAVAILLLFFISGVGELILIGSILAAVLITAMSFAFCYGLSVSKKWVKLLWFQEIKWFPMSEIIYIKLILKPDCVMGEVKVIGKKPYDFVFTDFCLGSATDLFPQLLSVRVHITPARAKRIAQSCSAMEKLRVIDLTTEEV